jgi:F-type H+-transporting ATPase subunit epsilon
MAEMNLHILTPERVVLTAETGKITVEAANGHRTFLPRHIDFVTALIPGILFFDHHEGEQFVGVDEGILVKCGSEVLVSVRNAVVDNDLGNLEKLIRERFRKLDEHEIATRAALNALEADMVRRFIELNKQ